MRLEVSSLKGNSSWRRVRATRQHDWHPVCRDSNANRIGLPSPIHKRLRSTASTHWKQSFHRAMSATPLIVLAALVLGCDAREETTAPLSNRTLTARSHYVAPNGTASGNGTLSAPWNLATALNQPLGVFPNDTIWLRGGTYQADFVSDLTGQAGKPIVLRQYPGERATIDGKFTVNGSYTYYWGFEVMYSDLRRKTTQTGPDPTDVPRNDKAVAIIGKFNKFINLVVHDMGDGVFAHTNSEGTEIYGCIVYNSGWEGGDGPYGNNLYMQNQGATKRVVDNVLFNSFLYNIQIYGSDAAALRNFYIESNSIFGGGDAMAGGNATNIVQWGGAPGQIGDFVYQANSIFHRQGSSGAIQLNAAGAVPGNNLTFSNNIVQGQSFFAEWQNYTTTNNLFTSGTSALSGQNVLISLRLSPGQSPSAHTWNNNTYYTAAASTQNPFYVYGSCAPNCNTILFSGWRSATGYDAGGTFFTGVPTTNQTIVLPNQYESWRAFITVWNWSGAATANVNISSVVAAGQPFAIRHVYNLYGPPIVSGVHSGALVSIPLTGHTAPRPIGYSTTPPSTGAAFNVFLLTKS